MIYKKSDTGNGPADGFSVCLSKDNGHVLGRSALRVRIARRPRAPCVDRKRVSGGDLRSCSFSRPTPGAAQAAGHGGRRARAIGPRGCSAGRDVRERKRPPARPGGAAPRRPPRSPRGGSPGAERQRELVQRFAPRATVYAQLELRGGIGVSLQLARVAADPVRQRTKRGGVSDSLVSRASSASRSARSGSPARTAASAIRARTSCSKLAAWISRKPSAASSGAPPPLRIVRPARRRGRG